MQTEVDRNRIRELGADQGGCVSASQLADAGLALGDVEELVADGFLTRTVGGVYVIQSEALSEPQVLWTAILVAGPGSALSHWTALAMHGLCEMDLSEVWVTSPKARGERTFTTSMVTAATGRPVTIRVLGDR